MQFTSRRIIVILAAFLWQAGTGPVAAQGVNPAIDVVLGDHVRYEAVIRAFQAGVARHDAAAVAALVHYPLTVRVGGRQMTVKNADGFVRHYDTIVTPAIAGVIAAQSYDALLVNVQGVMFGSGEAWINSVCADKACRTFEPKVVTIQAAPDR